jgi:hypothetical protein
VRGLLLLLLVVAVTRGLMLLHAGVISTQSNAAMWGLLLL